MTRKKSPFNYNHIFVNTRSNLFACQSKNYKDYRLFYNISVVKPDDVRSIPQ